MTTRDLDRLQRQALDGDLDAARRWIASARRRNIEPAVAARTLLERAIDTHDARMLSALVPALDAFDSAVELLDGLWAQSDTERLARAAHGLGLGLDTSHCDALEACRKRANRRTRVRRLTRRHLLEALLRARLGGLGLATVSAGHAPATAKTGLTLAVLTEDAVVIGAGRSAGQTPGRVWHEVRPWQRDLVRNLDKARAWARHAADDRVSVPRVGLDAAAVEAVERRAIEVHDPVRKLLEGEPSRGAFNKLVSTVNKASSGDAEHVVREISEAIADWPDDVRVGTRRWLESLAADRRKGTWRSGWRLMRQLELTADVQNAQLDALLHCPAADSLRVLSFAQMSMHRVERLLGGRDWPALRRLQFRETRDSQVFAAIGAARASVRQRVRHLGVDAAHKWAPRLPDAMWLAPDGDEIEVAIDEIGYAATHRAFQSALDGLSQRLAPLRSLRLNNLHWQHACLPLITRGGMADDRHQLAIEAMRMTDADDLMRVVSPALEGLVLNFWGRGSPGVVTSWIARAEAAGLRRLMLVGPIDETLMHALTGAPIARALDVLFLSGGPLFNVDTWSTALGHDNLARLRVLGLPAVHAAMLVDWLRDRAHLPGLRQLHVLGSLPDEASTPLHDARPALDIVDACARTHP